MSRSPMMSLAAGCALALASSAASADDAAEKAEKKAVVDHVKAAQERRDALEKAATEQFTKLDKQGDGTLRGAEIPSGYLDRFDRNADGMIGRSEFVQIMTRPEKIRGLHFMRDVKARAAMNITTFDQDKNGKVERKEFAGDDYTFKKWDRNKDDFLTPNELTTMAEEQLEDIRKDMRDPQRNRFLNLFDLDYDRRVTLDEYDGPIAHFRKWDTDKDGAVTYDELYGDMMMRGDKEPPKPENVTVVEQHDTDKNGKVSREEFKGSDAAWERLDRNGDGVLTTADAR